VLVAQSLGALIAGAYARMFPTLPALLLISPAGGFWQPFLFLGAGLGHLPMGLL
jgi:pimeloyl-ACP methyl ester carboxylesterase